MACKQPQEKHRRLQEGEVLGEVGGEGGSQSGCMAWQNGAKMWHSSKVITTFDWLKSISRQRHELCIRVCVCATPCVCVCVSICLCIFTQTSFPSVRVCVCVLRDCADKRRYAWNQAETCLTYQTEPATRQAERQIEREADREGDREGDILATRAPCAASFREINFNWVTDTDANTKNHMNNQRTKLICLENSKCQLENGKESEEKPTQKSYLV